MSLKIESQSAFLLQQQLKVPVEDNSIKFWLGIEEMAEEEGPWAANEEGKNASLKQGIVCDEVRKPQLEDEENVGNDKEVKVWSIRRE